MEFGDGSHPDRTAVTENRQAYFTKLPIEMRQKIAECIENDNDLHSFRNACKATFDAVDCDNMSFWRRRFLANFELPMNVKSNLEFKEKYLERKAILKNGIGKDEFGLGGSPKEKKCLEVMRQMLLEAFSEKNRYNGLTFKSKNLEFALSFAKSHNLFNTVFNPKYQQKQNKKTDAPSTYTGRLLHVIQVMLAPCMLSFEIETPIFRFPESQQVVYSTTIARPFFTGATIDMELLLHHLNFWRYHMVRPEEMTLEQVYKTLHPSEMPQFWSTQLSNGNKQEIGTHWKGAYAFVDRAEIGQIRAGEGSFTQFQDDFCGSEDGAELQDLELQLDLNGEDGWFELFEQHLQSLSRPTHLAKTRAQKRSVDSNELTNKPRNFRFGGKGSDNEDAFNADGWLNPLPSQEGVPGWQRMTMMKYYRDPDTGVIDFQALWAYEGVVLPGGQIMLGRWWSPDYTSPEQMYSGPFLLWCIDGDFEKLDHQRSKEER